MYPLIFFATWRVECATVQHVLLIVKPEVLEKKQNCQRPCRNQFGWKRKSASHKQSKVGFCCPWFIKYYSLLSLNAIVVDKTKKNQELQWKRILRNILPSVNFLDIDVLNKVALVSSEQKRSQNRLEKGESNHW